MRTTTEGFGEAGQYNGKSRLTDYYQQVLERVRAVPGVESAAGIGFLPLSHRTSNSFVGVDGRPPTPMKGVEGLEMLVRHIATAGRVLLVQNAAGGLSVTLS